MKKVNNLSQIEALFYGWDESMLRSCFQKVMGEAYVEQEEHPNAAIVYVNCFGFAAGEPNRQLVEDWYNDLVGRFAIITAKDDSWNTIFEDIGKDKCRRVKRYAIKKEANCFQKDRLTDFVEALAPEYQIRQIDKELYHACKTERWSADFVQWYKDYNQFEKYGLGFVILHEGKPISGASSYASFSSGIEIEIDTKEEYRRQGLATICGAKLILECLKRGWYPSWDAQNLWSVALAEKLGYHYSHTYTAYEIWK